MQLYEAGIMQKLLKKKFFKTILLTLPILIVLQDVSYALSPTSRFRPITNSDEQLSQPPDASSQAKTVSDVFKPQKENEPVPISLSEKLKAALNRYNNPDTKAPPDFSEGQNFIHQILFAAEKLPEAEEIKEEAAHVLAKWVLKLLEALAGQIKKMHKAEDFEGIIKAIDEKFLSQPIIKQTWNEEHRLPLFKEFEPETGNHFLAHIRGGPLSRICMYTQLIREVQPADKKYSEYKEKIREAIKDTDTSLGQFRDKLAESLYEKKELVWGETITPQDFKIVADCIIKGKPYRAKKDIKEDDLQQFLIRIIQQTCDIKEDDHPTKPQIALLKDIIYPFGKETLKEHLKEYRIRYKESLLPVSMAAAGIKEDLTQAELDLRPFLPVLEACLRLSFSGEIIVELTDKLRLNKEGVGARKAAVSFYKQAKKLNQEKNVVNRDELSRIFWGLLYEAIYQVRGLKIMKLSEENRRDIEEKLAQIFSTEGEKGDGSDLNTPASLAGNAPIKASGSLKSVEAEGSRDLKPFFKKHELGFQNTAAVIIAVRKLKDLIIDKKKSEDAISAKIGKLNKTFPSGEIEIKKKIKTGTFQCSRKEYKYAVFHFKKEDKAINVLFLEDHAALTSDELAELRIQDIEKRHLDCPGLEGVWFINPDAILKQTGSEPPAMPTAPPDAERKPQPRIGGTREPVLEREAIQKKINLLEDTKRKLENNEFPAIINFGDKHGVADDLERILQAAKKANRDGKRLVIIGHGDAFDRGDQSFRNFEILQELKKIAESNPNIFVYLCFGNHDVLVIQALLLNNDNAHDMWLNQGGRQAVDEFSARGVDMRRLTIWMLNNLKIFHIDEMGFLHLHAGIPMDKNGNPLISMKQLKAWQDDLDSIKQALNQDPAFLDSESNRLRLAKLFDEAEDIFWVRQDGWIANLMDGGEAARIRIDERNKAELFSLLKENIKAIMPSISKAQIEEQIKENWARILIQFEEQFKMAGIEFEVSGQEPKINKDKLDRFLAQLGVNGVVFGHTPASELINIDNRIFCVDVDDVNSGDEGYLIFNGEGIKFNAMRRGEDLIAAPATMIADIDAQIIRLEKRLVVGAAQEEATEVLRKIVEGMELGIMPAIAPKGLHLNLGDIVISVHTGTRRKILSVDRVTGIVQVERTDTSGKVDRDEIDIADIVKAVQKGIARIERTSSTMPINVNNEKTAIEVQPAFIKEIAETRQAAIVEMLNALEEKGNDVKVVVGVPIDMNKANVQPALSAINRGLAKNGFGRMEDNKQVITFEIDKIDTVKTTQNQERAMQKAREGLAPNGRIVLFAPQMEGGPQLAGKAQEAYKDQSNITVVPDAYTDSAPEQNVFPDIMVRVALGRNIAFYYTGKDPQGTLASINDLLAKVADGSAPIITVDDLLNILKPLRIRPVYYNAITDWQRAQEAVATSL